MSADERRGAADAIERLDARHQRPHGPIYGPNVCMAPECKGAWPCDTVFVLALARRVAVLETALQAELKAAQRARGSA